MLGAAMRDHLNFDVLIIGAGLSGVAAAYYVQRSLSDKRYAVLEAREAIGGTWDLFRYPGVRSDSDMNTLGFSFNPWGPAKTIADGAEIREYVKQTARQFGIDRHIQFKSRMVAADWTSEGAYWTVQVDRGEKGVETLTCAFLYMSTGYYDFDQGYQPAWAGLNDFEGALIHPQHWPEKFDYTGKNVVIIGSGATAVTLAPAMAQLAGSVSVLQRSPTYVVSRPAIDPAVRALKRWLPAGIANRLARWKNIVTGIYIYKLSRSKPQKVKTGIAALTRKALGPDYDMRHFTPRYDPWDQRLCLIPDGDLFAAIKDGSVEMVTDEIARFTQTGVALESGAHLEADVVVSATGLTIQLMGKAMLSIDGVPTRLGDRIGYKGAMFSDLPNFAYAFGYTNASWTLKCELTAAFACRLIRKMDREGFDWCAPELAAGVRPERLLSFSSGYIQRAKAELPHQGDRAPWRVHQNYVRDLIAIRFGRIEDGVMKFGRAASCLRRTESN
jgi:cation diffusion facilitator CzcD-associated flavoprotein CzcO